MFDWIGWLATAVFASSYACREQVTLRRMQGLAALMWLVYGALIHALPVVVANVIVAGAAIWSSFARPATTAPQRVTAEDPLPSDQG
jgi:hypothetical protein